MASSSTERTRRQRERQRAAAATVGGTHGTLHAAAVRAQAEAVARLGDDAPRFQAAIERYVNAVEVADTARREWERNGRELWTQGSQGQLVEHPLIRTMDRLDRAAAAFGAALGLDPASEKRLGRIGQPGRPEGAVSADDRKAEPPRLTPGKLRAVR